MKSHVSRTWLSRRIMEVYNARLARVEERAIDEFANGIVDVGVGTDVSRVFAAELETDAFEGQGRDGGLIDPLATW